MAKDIDPEVGKVLKSYGYDRSAVWDCHGTWVVYHHILERIAANAGITFQSPHVCCSDIGNVAICVHGEMGTGDNSKIEWSIGEASPKNNKNAYPWAMAEKRAKDRVILKLIGLHGLVYSEQEADEFKDERPDKVKGNVTAAKKALQDFINEVHACDDEDTLDAYINDNKTKALIKRFYEVIPELANGDGSYEMCGIDGMIGRRRKLIKDNKL